MFQEDGYFENLNDSRSTEKNCVLLVFELFTNDLRRKFEREHKTVRLILGLVRDCGVKYLVLRNFGE